MKLLFFDTECSSCAGGAKICEFGYVLTDEKFNVLKKENLLIDPQSKFNVYGFRRAGIKLSYTYSEYYASPTLEERYPVIKKLMTDENTLPVGYSCDNDARFFLSDFRRLRLPAFNYRFLDVISLYRDGLKRANNLSLDAVYAETGKEELAHHQAMNDALMTMEVLKHYLELAGTTLRRVVGDCKYAFGEVFDGRIVIGDKPFRYADGNKMTGQNKRVLAEFLKEKRVTAGDLDGRSFCFAKDYEAEHFPSVLKAADIVTDRGGAFTEVLSYADYIVAQRSFDKIRLRKKKKRSAKIITIAEFCKMLSIDPSVIADENVAVDEVLAKSVKNKDWYARYIAAKKKKLK